MLQPEYVPPFKRDEFIGVAVPGNPAPLAVGVAVCGREDALAKQTGKLVEVKQVGPLCAAKCASKPICAQLSVHLSPSVRS